MINDVNFFSYKFLTIQQEAFTSGPYGNLEMTSGAIQYGVPTSDLRLGSSCDTCAQNPKSDSLTCSKLTSDYISS